MNQKQHPSQSFTCQFRHEFSNRIMDKYAVYAINNASHVQPICE